MAAVTWPSSGEDDDSYINIYSYIYSDDYDDQDYMYEYDEDDDQDYMDVYDEDEDGYMEMYYYNTSVDVNNNLVSENVPNEGMIKRVLRKVRPRRWIWIKWLFIVLNVLLEVRQATIAQENAQGKISKMSCLKMSVITCCFCLIISVTEMIKEGKDNKVVWRKRGYCCWFYYVGMEGKPRLFGRFSLYFGIVSSMIQLVVNLVSLVLKKNVIHFDLLPVLLSSAYLVAEIIGRKDKSERTMV